MDAAYVKFMMCQCLINRADWGLAIGCMNVVYSFFLFQFWMVELIKSAGNYPVKWVLLYGFNVMFNVITMMRIVKRESAAVFYWMCETGALLIFRLHHIYFHEDEFWLVKSELYKVSNIIIDVYIGLSMLAMIYVMCGLRFEPDRSFPEGEMVNDCKFDPEAVKKAVQTDGENVFEKSEGHHIENVLGMEELNRKAMPKLADLEDKTTPRFEATAPVEESLPSGIFSIHEIPEPSAPPESKLSLDEDFFNEINDISPNE
ncbi:uncharacterized protein [Drosophila takahashii]|uniref:uncharacterized protein n=1 Tax=Drosophila takahashii TaxID=29030 RepID=UPI001CF8A443|nr:uncharacterized protein LOC108069006 [Drosophila takahashii]